MHTDQSKLEDKVTLISGTGGGQGRVAARLFAAAGAKVVACDIDEGAATETERLVREDGNGLVSLSGLDISTAEGAASWIDAAIDAHGRIDLLYNNASSPKFGPFPDVTPEDYQFTIANELHVVWFPTQAAWPHLAERSGAILNVGSIAGVSGVRALPQAAHAATKGAVIALTRQLAAEGAADGIRVNCISPGVISSPPVRELLELGDDSPLNSAIAATFNHSPGEPEDIVYAAMYLLSEEAKWVTGTHLVIDGGASVLI